MRGFEIEELFICECGDPSHQFIISADKETTEGPCAFISVHLNREHNIFKRIWYAIKYYSEPEASTVTSMRSSSIPMTLTDYRRLWTSSRSIRNKKVKHGLCFTDFLYTGC